MQLLQNLMPEINEGTIRLIVPFIIMTLLLLITLHISNKQHGRMPNSIWMIMILCAVCMAVTKTTFLGTYDMFFGFIVSFIFSLFCSFVFQFARITIHPPYIKYFSALGLYLGLYNLLNIFLFSLLYYLIINHYIQKKIEDSDYESTTDGTYAGKMLFTSVVVAIIIVLIQFNIIPVSNSILNISPVSVFNSFLLKSF